MNNEFEPACDRMEWLDPFYKAVWEKAFAEAIPISGTFELTPRCNFDCRMCYVHLKESQIPHYGKELSAKEWIRIAHEAKEAGTTWLCITGGEPLMHREFETIWKEISQMGFFITLQTNASLIRGRTAELLAQYPPRSAKVTLYGSNNEVYEKVCGVKEGFSLVDEGLKTLWELKIPIQLLSTIIRQNQSDVPRMAYYAYLHKLPWMATVSVKPSVRGSENDIEAERLTEKIEEIRKKEIQHFMDQPVDINRKPCTYCKDYRLGYWVTWNGEMRFCSFMNEPNILVMEKGFQESWKELIEYEESLIWPRECYECEANKICLKCVGVLNAECGSCDKVRETFCRKYKKYMDEFREV